MMKTIDQLENRKQNLCDNEILELLNINNESADYYRLLAASNHLSRQKFGQKAYVFAQVGINAEPCPINCKFCSMGYEHYSLDDKWQKGEDDILYELESLQQQGIDDFFLMTTADYPLQRFLEIAKKVKSKLRPDQRFVANIGDFDLNDAIKLMETGITGVYHINRLREGTDTLAKTECRERTINAAINAGLELYYCIEPIGPEHTYEELLTEIKRAKDLQIAVMAVMRRIPVPGTPLYDMGMINSRELTKIAAVTNLVVNPSRSMNIHEPIQMGLLAGVNQLYAESGANPRDIKSETSENRGFTPKKAWEMLYDGGMVRTSCF